MARKPEDAPVTRRFFETTIAGLESRRRADMSDVRSDISVLKGDVAVLKTDVAELKTDVAELKTDVAVLKTDVAVLKTDVAGLKTDVAGLKTEMSDFRAEVREGFQRMFVEMERRSAAHDASDAALHAKLDKNLAMYDHSAGEQADNRRMLIVHDAMLADHRRRLESLESRRPPAP